MLARIDGKCQENGGFPPFGDRHSYVEMIGRKLLDGNIERGRNPHPSLLTNLLLFTHLASNF